MLCWLSKKYVEKFLPSRLTHNGKCEMKFADYGDYVEKQDQSSVSGLIGTLHDDAVPEEVKEKYFKLFIQGI